MTALFQQDKAEVFNNTGKRFFDPGGGVGVIIAMDGDNRALYSLAQ